MIKVTQYKNYKLLVVALVAVLLAIPALPIFAAPPLPSIEEEQIYWLVLEEEYLPDRLMPRLGAYLTQLQSEEVIARFKWDARYERMWVSARPDAERVLRELPGVSCLTTTPTAVCPRNEILQDIKMHGVGLHGTGQITGKVTDNVTENALGKHCCLSLSL